MIIGFVILIFAIKIKNGRVPYIWAYYNIFYKVSNVVVVLIAVFVVL